MTSEVLILAEQLAGGRLADLHPEEREFYILQASRYLRRHEEDKLDKMNHVR